MSGSAWRAAGVLQPLPLPRSLTSSMPASLLRQSRDRQPPWRPRLLSLLLAALPLTAQV